ncbi:MAG: ABC transporter permease subunit [Pseudomonadota bacterium]|nr:ABC transporter permease subunit [Pseudomonadota bacterium]
MSKTGITRDALSGKGGSDAQKAVLRRLLMRSTIDKAATRFIGFGGISIIVAVLLIFVFLFLEVVPMFVSAEVEPLANGKIQTSEQRLLAVDSDDRGEVLVRLTEENDSLNLALSKFNNLDVTTTSVDLPYESGRQWIYDSVDGWYVNEDHGHIHFGQIKEKEIFQDGERTLAPKFEQVSKGDGFTLAEDADVKLMQFKALSNALALSYAITDDAQNTSYYLQVWKKARSFMSTTATYKTSATYELPVTAEPKAVFIDNQLRWAYAVHESGIDLINVKGKEPKFHSTALFDHKMTSTSMLLGNKSILVGDADGGISQWSLVRDEENNFELARLRRLEHNNAPIIAIKPEDRRRGFYAVDANGKAGVFFTTSERKLAEWDISDLDLNQLHLISSPRSNALIAYDNQKIEIFHVKNEHPEVSFKSMWQKVWYEGYAEPEYIWQSSAATNDFEPKLSLAPLAYGTLKATFYAMLFALPLAICGAIYTAYFMAPAVRKKVKPAIEFMEALPTVILGFLAGIWLAPMVESYLPGVLLSLFMLPVVMILISFIWTVVLPKNIKALVPDGWEPVLLGPFIALTVYVCFAFSYPLEAAFFGGDAKIWMRDTLGIAYDQRNSLVVGIAMGFAIIPTIFSIAEDAVFAVPKSLTFGSLALGASPWQTLVRVVLPTASPGIFSAVMIGTGRAVGETMIVLMATGSTPIMDMNIFEGFRTLSANIAIEMPEAEVHSTHYRLLFFAAFCLFMFTFLFNTTAEVVRQRLREKYGSL